MPSDILFCAPTVTADSATAAWSAAGRPASVSIARPIAATSKALKGGSITTTAVSGTNYMAWFSNTQ